MVTTLDIFDLGVRLICLLLAAIAFLVAREFGFMRKRNGQTELGHRLVYVFVAVAWLGLAIFLGGMVRVYTLFGNYTVEFQYWRIAIVRLVSVLPLLYALAELARYIIRDHAAAFKVRRMPKE